MIKFLAGLMLLTCLTSAFAETVLVKTIRSSDKKYDEQDFKFSFEVDSLTSEVTVYAALGWDGPDMDDFRTSRFFNIKVHGLKFSNGVLKYEGKNGEVICGEMKRGWFNSYKLEETGDCVVEIDKYVPGERNIWNIYFVTLI